MEKGIVMDTNAEMWTGSVIEREVEGWRKECTELCEHLSPWQARLEYTEIDGVLEMKAAIFYFLFFGAIYLVYKGLTHQFWSWSPSEPQKNESAYRESSEGYSVL